MSTIIKVGNVTVRIKAVENPNGNCDGCMFKDDANKLSDCMSLFPCGPVSRGDGVSVIYVIDGFVDEES